jgi:hypothetical protein
MMVAKSVAQLWQTTTKTPQAAWTIPFRERCFVGWTQAWWCGS